MTARILGLACKALMPIVLVLAVMGADATTRAAATWPHLPWWIAHTALAAGALTAGIWTITATRQEQP